MNVKTDVLSSAAGLPLRGASLRLLRAFVMLALFGLGIGLLRAHDILVALLLACVTVVAYAQTCRRIRVRSEAVLIAAGILLTGAIGVAGEKWGIGNGHWAYHDLPDGRDFARWLPFAWGLAFLFLYRLERRLVMQFGLRSLRQKMALTLLLAIVFPAWGEAVAINAGVWTYYWPYQLLGVPLLAIVMLTACHTLVFGLFSLISRKLELRESLFYWERF